MFDIQDELQDVEKFIEDYNGTCKGGVTVTFNEDPMTIPDPTDHDPEGKNLLILDDIMLGPQSKVLQYYVRNGKYNFVTLDIMRSINQGKIRKNLDEYWTPMK